MSLVEILEVSRFEVDLERLWGYSIDNPITGNKNDIYAINIEGWVLGRESPISEVELMDTNGMIIRRVPIIPRPDVAAHYPQVPGAENCGFATAVGVLGMPLEFEILIQAVFQNESRLPLGVVRGRRQPIRSSFQPKLRPLMITSLGRTGTTYLMRLLGQHPRIVVYWEYPYEVRAAVYWVHMLKVLSEPSNYRDSSNPDEFCSNIWWVGHNPFYSEFFATHPEIRYWFGRIYVEQLASFCQLIIENFYNQVADNQNIIEPIYFAEKHLPIHTPWLMWELYTNAREIILVRDFRDMFCSILAFNAKRGYTSFNRKDGESDAEYIRSLGNDVLKLVNSWKQRSDRAYLVRYEDLVLRPNDTLVAILRYLDLDCSPLIVENMIKRASRDTPELREHRTSPDPKASIERWRYDLNSLLQAVCQEVFGEALKEFGYLV